MTRFGVCKHCVQQFLKRRTNHMYCSASCRTKASYKRNNYRYVSGHYEKVRTDVNDKLALPVNPEVLSVVQKLEEKIERLSQKNSMNSTSIKEAAIGTIAADATAYAAKKIFAPKSLPATKGDLEMLKKEFVDFKKMIFEINLKKFPFE
ncbi:hypothetical protein DMZ43_02415 [Meridianimaribacter sp. CL38]|jgi:hypothetical protein|uniref:hypothetical protein n=1 Tax=Meridianimaribacter sp. CL38 TaxID=2213021 RepID=UPI0010407082|nr:hypothetical protein [Meridianimaribacter sp. CL38]TBV27917.1 hypothetical protein DMZ43_02415 [Meridianimaribacter sp. CL38]